jgi:DNA-binding MarR family transcriptional regulator
MNRNTTPNSPRRKTPSVLAAPPAVSTSVQTAAETVYKVAEVSRTLKCATNVVEKWVKLASGSDGHLTLLHWLVLVRLSGTTTCKQLDLKSDTKIAPAYLTRLLDDLTNEGLVRRHRSSSDRRQILLTLTERGRELARGLLASLSDVTQPIQLDAIEHLASSLQQFVSLTDCEK